MIEVKWNELKKFVDDRNISIQFVELDDFYVLVAFDNYFQLKCEIRKDEAQDFEDNYKTTTPTRAMEIPSTIASNRTEDGKVLFAKIHGLKADVPAGGTHRFQLINPYAECYFQGAEILDNIISVCNFKIRHQAQVAADNYSDPQNPIYGGEIEQYGYSVNIGVIKYIREAKYAARIPQGLVVECEAINDSEETREMGVNFILHDIREPDA